MMCPGHDQSTPFGLEFRVYAAQEKTVARPPEGGTPNESMPGTSSAGWFSQNRERPVFAVLRRGRGTRMRTNLRATRFLTTRLNGFKLDLEQQVVPANITARADHRQGRLSVPRQPVSKQRRVGRRLEKSRGERGVRKRHPPRIENGPDDLHRALDLRPRVPDVFRFSVGRN